jgi:SAM-dependent MidA family methyltransferase
MLSVNNASQNNLAARLRARIQRDGPISFHDWMQAALYDERDGYYIRPDLIRQGRAGDYRTAPETSPLFAATFAQYFMKSYFDLGAPPRLTIVEAGGGTGEFARGVLASLQSNFPRIFDATHYLIDEVNPEARARIGARLAQFEERVEFSRLGEIREPFAHAIIFSNELIDAFPVYRVIGRGQTLKELCVGVNQAGEFVWVESDLTGKVADYCARIGLQLSEGQIFEVNLELEDFVSRAAALLNEGLVITVDYGATRDELLNAPHRFGGTLRAFRGHQFVDNVLANPGEQDLTTTVDWTQMQRSGAGCGLETLRLERLDLFLMSEGLFEALSDFGNRLVHAADIVNLQTGAREMVRPDGLAASFQVLIQRKVVGD